MLVLGFPVSSLALALLNYTSERSISNLRTFLSTLERLNNAHETLPVTTLTQGGQLALTRHAAFAIWPPCFLPWRETSLASGQRGRSILNASLNSRHSCWPVSRLRCYLYSSCLSPDAGAMNPVTPDPSLTLTRCGSRHLAAPGASGIIPPADKRRLPPRAA